jgi:hypothetical protein
LKRVEVFAGARHPGRSPRAVKKMFRIRLSEPY